MLDLDFNVYLIVIDPARHSDQHHGRYRASSMLCKGDVLKDGSDADCCSTGDLAKVQHTVYTATSEAWTALYNMLDLMHVKLAFVHWQVSTLSLKKLFGILLSRLSSCVEECFEETFSKENNLV
ncbi:tubulin alpha chain-like isoform X2 [Biomphalaria glabrata]|uniref:Tubulin alpha chain-like isoform X2 n=1 Tax=Biomphalaria glabrata TaxID=6526 RepID=A0A9W2ZP67_BIOGL|nr:tubulin alpha chain-like isoform X2 [Biomphalaria glabrata]